MREHQTREGVTRDDRGLVWPARGQRLCAEELARSQRQTELACAPRILVEDLGVAGNDQVEAVPLFALLNNRKARGKPLHLHCVIDIAQERRLLGQQGKCPYGSR